MTFGSQDSALRELNERANQSSLLPNGFTSGEDLNVPVNLQLSQPQQQINETTVRAMKLRKIQIHIKLSFFFIHINMNLKIAADSRCTELAVMNQKIFYHAYHQQHSYGCTIILEV